jgi:hypothetical protein
MSTAPEERHVPWRRGAWRGHVLVEYVPDVDALLALGAIAGGRRSRHARTVPVLHEGHALWVKTYPAHGARFARRAFGMHRALAGAGFVAPEVALVGWDTGEGVLITRDAGGVALLEALAERSGLDKRRLLASLGAEVARLHRAGFVPGDLVPSNVLVRGEDLVLLDHDRTRRSRTLVWWHGRRNLVQLGRFVVPGLTLTDRARVVAAYAAARGWRARRRRRLARWLVEKITARRARVDGIDGGTANAVGFRALMRSGGPWDPTAREGR